jgi:DNA polymerase
VQPIHIDIESYSEESLKKAGMYKYSEHVSTEIWEVCWSQGDGPVNVWIPWGAYDWQWDEFDEQYFIDGITAWAVRKKVDLGDIYITPECPPELVEHAKKGGQFRAHNSGFERTMLNGKPGQQIQFPHTEIDQWVCTASMAAAHSLPRALGNVATELESHGKDQVGKQDMLAICKPRTGKIKRYTPQNAPDRFVRAYCYCIDDVLAERGIDKLIPDLSPHEQKVFFLDQLINDRGVRVDLPAVANVQVLIKKYKIYLKKRCREITEEFGGTPINPSQTEKIANWIREQGYPMENLQAATMKAAVADKKVPPQVKKVVSIRLLDSMKAISKYNAMERAVMADGRLHGMFLYHGAGTGRWSSMIVQLQNLFRPIIKDPENAIEAFNERELDWIRALYSEDPMKVFASCVRGMLIPGDGYDLLAMDYAAIEARGVAWLAGQEDILDVFRDHGKIYEYTASSIYHTPRELHLLKAMADDFPERRFVGKVAVLALGYQGGKKAFAKMAKNYGVEIPEEEAEEIKVNWRKANPKIVQLWYDMEAAAINALEDPGHAYALQSSKKIIFKVEGDFLYMRLPGGRRLAYFKPELRDGKITYMGIDTYSRRWMRCSTYGGKLTENAVQAISRDLLVLAMFRLEEAGYPIIGTVHDEVILEILEAFGSQKEVAQIMCILPKWADGLPVKAEGFRAKRYRK